MSNSRTGYSGKPLYQKLGLKDSTSFFLINAPEDYPEWLECDFEVPKGNPPFDLIHIFSDESIQLEKWVQKYLPALDQNGAIWISWPKKAAKVPTDITEDTVRAIIFPLGMVDVKVCSVSPVWSGLKVVIRKENRK